MLITTFESFYSIVSCYSSIFFYYYCSFLISTFYSFIGSSYSIFTSSDLIFWSISTNFWSGSLMIESILNSSLLIYAFFFSRFSLTSLSCFLIAIDFLFICLNTTSIKLTWHWVKALIFAISCLSSYLLLLNLRFFRTWSGLSHLFLESCFWTYFGYRKDKEFGVNSKLWY